MQIKPFILSAPMTAVVAIAVSVRSVCGEGFSRFWIFFACGVDFSLACFDCIT